jgi:hypothetical protein
MLKKLNIKKIIAVIAGILLSLCIITGCTKVSKVEAISVNQGEILAMTPTNKNTNNVNSESPDLSKVETVSYCELIKNPMKYDHKIVRLRAIYFNAFERSFLYDETCEAGKPPTAPEKVPAETWAEWDKSFVSKGDSEEAVLNRELNGFGRKDVTITGKFNSTNEQNGKDGPNLFGHMGSCRFQFQIMRLEKIENQDAELSVGSFSTPTETYKTAFAARQKKDVKALKLTLSRKMLEFFSEMGKMEKKTADEMLGELVQQPQAKTAEVRNEKIYDDEAVLEYLDEKGFWKPMAFVKEGSNWKMTISDTPGR